MITLAPMSPDDFAAFAARANEAYAQDNILCGRWSADEALAKATEEFTQMLPRGIETPDHHFYDIRSADEYTVGHLWFARVGSGSAQAGYVFWIHVAAQHRRQGHARAALLALEPMAAAMGLGAIRLSVFAHNPNAETLYRSLGYRVTATSMRKVL